MTYDPIKAQLSHLPKVEPATVVVMVERDKAQIAERNRASILRSASERIGLRAALIALGIFVIAVLVIGAAAILLVALAAAAAAFLFLRRDHPISTALLGDAPSYVTIDTSRHTIKDSRKIQIEAGIHAELTVEYNVRAKSPVRVYEEGVRDVKAFLSQKVFSKVAQIPSNVMADNGQGYLKQLLKLTEEVTSEKFDPVFQIEDMTVDAAFVGSAGELIRKINTNNIEARADKLQAELDSTRMERVLELVDDPRKLQAAMMLPGSDRAVIKEAIDRIATSREIEHSRRMEMFNIAVAEGWVEAKDIKVKYPEIQDIIQSAVRTESGGIAKVESARLARSEVGSGAEKKE